MTALERRRHGVGIVGGAPTGRTAAGRHNWFWYTMAMPESGDHLPAQRASDGEREAVAARLQTAAGEGRLTLDELAERLEGALAAVTRGDLDALTADLPALPATASPGPKPRRWIVGIMGGGDHRGRWRIASRCTVVNVMGGADLDLTDAVVEGPQTEIRVFSLMGGSDIVVPEGVHVQLSGFAFMGANDLSLEDMPPAPAGAPVVHIRAYSVMGGTDVRLRTPGGSRRPRLHGHR